jgi:hypothetical protein
VLVLSQEPALDDQVVALDVDDGPDLVFVTRDDFVAFHGFGLPDPPPR